MLLILPSLQLVGSKINMKSCLMSFVIKCTMWVTSKDVGMCYSYMLHSGQSQVHDSIINHNFENMNQLKCE